MAWSAVFPSGDGDSKSSAFVVGDGRHVITVALSGAKTEAGKLISDERLLPAEVILDPVSRLVVFRLSGPPGRAIPMMSESILPPGSPVKSADGIEGKSSGWVKQVEGKILPLSLLKIDYPAKVPLPGTPLMNAAGNVVAVAHQPIGAKSGYAIPVEVVRRVLEDVQRGGHVSRGWIGLYLRPDAKSPQVTRVQEGSPSALAGVKTGDVLLQVGPRSLTEYADAVNAFFFLRPGVATPVRLKRGNEELTLSLTPVERRVD
ncbi:S1C family serine protease [Luteolibacter flavescens]|uniref:S1C family serine protease n=1 Tax=Luteolibacter flavescens TaxID=1859460 RepID=A0ABT3FLN0_9BACT|nr:S1C family serine protease [Luteolibacter flavescens]MCW1884476.1 S1C family serine protease [Luteolibacter flavescens]